MGEIPAGLVEKYYHMNPDQEDLLWNASALRDGMIVLLADSEERVDLDWPRNWRFARKLTAYEKSQSRIFNRWCRVTNLEISPTGQVVWLTALYADGFKYKRMHPHFKAWLVKLDSLEDMYPVDPKLI